MKLEFDDIQQLKDFAYTFALGIVQEANEGQQIRARGWVVSDDELCATADVLDEAMSAMASRVQSASEPAPEADEPADDGVVHEHIDLPPATEQAPTEPQPEAEKPKRKRRTKAEIAADEAMAREEAPTIEAMFGDEQDAADIAELIADHPGLAPDPVEAEPTQDAPQASAESLQKHADAQTAYTPELLEQLKAASELYDASSPTFRKEHLEEGRKAIDKKGFIAYMATFKGLGLDSAIAMYSDEQVKLHRAAIAHLLAS